MYIEIKESSERSAPFLLCMKEYAKTFYKSQAWKRTREAYIRSVGGLCERCRRKGLIVPAEIVHHKIYLTPENISDETVSLSWANLEAVCRTCHKEEHTGKVIRYEVDSLGRVSVK